MTEPQITTKTRLQKSLTAGLIILVVTACLCTIYIAWHLSKVTGTPLDRSDDALGISSGTKDAPGHDNAPLNIALLGIDQEKMEDIGRSDVIMVMSIDKQNRTIKLASIMRDTYVNIPGYGMDKITHAYAYGGPQLTLSTINSNFGLDIRDFAAVSFANMEKIIDDLGGLDIEVTEEEVPFIHRLEAAGMQHLNGRQAVDYMQIRSVGNGDYQRTERQRIALTKIIRKMQATDPYNLPDIVGAFLPYTTTSLSQIDLIKLGADALAADLNNIHQIRIPIDGRCEGTMIDGVYYLAADLPANAAALHDFIYATADANQQMP